MKWIAISQTFAIVAAGAVLPFYTIYLQQATNSYSVFAFIYATFTLSAALTHLCIGWLSLKVSARTLLVTGNAISGLSLVLVPAISALWQLYVVQIILGSSVSLQKSGEKIAVAAVTHKNTRARLIGNYHAVVAIATAVVLFATGWLLDTFSLIFVFYLAAFWLVIAAILSMKVKV